jgi:hypothetical protein
MCDFDQIDVRHPHGRLMSSSTKADGKEEMDEGGTGLDTESHEPQKQKHDKRCPEHVSLLGRDSLHTFTF